MLLPEPIEDDARKLLGSRRLRILQSQDPKPDAVALRTGIRRSSELVESACRLTQISRTGAGFDNVDGATRKGVIIPSSIATNTHTVADENFRDMGCCQKKLGIRQV